MNIFFSCSIPGGRADEPAYQAITAALLEAGHQVPTAYLAEAVQLVRHFTDLL